MRNLLKPFRQERQKVITMLTNLSELPFHGISPIVNHLEFPNFLKTDFEKLPYKQIIRNLEQWIFCSILRESNLSANCVIHILSHATVQIKKDISRPISRQEFVFS